MEKKLRACVAVDECIGCGVCVDVCPVDAIHMIDGVARINQDCISCGNCVSVCPVMCITMEMVETTVEWT